MWMRQTMINKMNEMDYGKWNEMEVTRKMLYPSLCERWEMMIIISNIMIIVGK